MPQSDCSRLRGGCFVTDIQSAFISPHQEELRKQRERGGKAPRSTLNPDEEVEIHRAFSSLLVREVFMLLFSQQRAVTSSYE